MKRICLFLSLLLVLPGCTKVPQDNSILVFIEEVEGCTVDNNGQRVAPGENAVFTLTFDSGIGLAGTDYSGKTRTETNHRTVTLTLEDVRRPTRVRLSLTHDYVDITYHANGGYALHSADSQSTVTYSLNNHTRPNTDTGTDLFVREGYTLVSWNTKADGTGTQVGLGSRVSIPNGSLELYAQWAQWCPEADFSYTVGGTVTITGYSGSSDPIVIPETIDGVKVTGIGENAFSGCSAGTVILPKSMEQVAARAFVRCNLHTLILFDNITSIHDRSFVDCENLKTLRINAIEAPFGYSWRRESCYADKVDLLIHAQGSQKLVFYGGCSMWYNLDSTLVRQEFGENYTVINMGLNGTVNSAVQMQILGHFLEAGDIFFHTPELSSKLQMLTNTDLLDTDKPLWCGLENNYDLFALVDLTTVGGVFDSLCAYLDRKDGRTDYLQVYRDELEQTYCDTIGGIPFARVTKQENLGDNVYLDPSQIDEASIFRLDQYYDWYSGKGVKVYLSYACFNLDAVPLEQRGNAAAMEAAFSQALEQMDHALLISRMEDFFYREADFYDTNYHLLSDPARNNTAIWLRDLKCQMIADGLWKEAGE